MEKLYISKAFLKMASGRLHAPHPTHKLQKPSKESGIFQSLGTINFVLFTERQSQKGGGGGGHGPIAHRLISDVKNQRYRLSAVKLASSSRTRRSFFWHPQEVRAPPIGNRCSRLLIYCLVSKEVKLADLGGPSFL